jgi:hypothetical protein
MIEGRSGLEMGVGSVSRQLKGVGVLTMPNAGLEKRDGLSLSVSFGCMCALIMYTRRGGWSID